MTVPTSEQLSRLRQRPHGTTLHLSVYEPNTVLAAQITMAAISRGEREIDIAILGGVGNGVSRGQTCYIGSTPNGRDFGRIRAISSTPTQLTVAENDINWRDGLYLTVVQYFEPWAVFPRILLNDFVPSFFKDWDIAYVDQNENFDPVVNMGPNHAMFLDNTPTGSWASIYYDSSGTFDPSDNATPTGFAWVFEGGIPTGSNAPDPGYIDYTGGGHFLTSLTVTSPRGKTFTGRRHVSVYTRPDQGPMPPIVGWGLSSFEGSRDNGGYALRLWLRENADFSRILPGSLIVIFSDDYEGSFAGKAGGNAENRSSILFAGYIEDGSVALNAITNRLEFRVTSITGTMKRLSSFSLTLESKVDAETWNEVTDGTVDKAMIHYLRWHSTILAIADFSPTGDSKPVQFMDFERSSVYDAVSNLYGSALVATVVADRQGKVWAEIDANLLQTGSARGLNTALSLTRQDWRGTLDIQERIDERLSYLEMGGIAYNGPTTGSSDPFLAGAPGDAPAYFGSLERATGLVIEGQVQLNELVGLAFAKANSDYPEVGIPMAGEYRILDIAPQERVLVSLEADETYRGVVWDQKAFLPTQVRYTYLASDQVLQMETILTEETEGPAGESVEIPVDPPFPLFIAPEINLPPFNLPPPLDLIPIDPVPGTGELAYLVTDNRITRSRNILDAGLDTIFEDITPTFAGDGVTGSFDSFYFDPLDPQNKAYLMANEGSQAGSVETGPNLYVVTNLDSASPTYTNVLGAAKYVASIDTTDGAAVGGLRGYDISISPVNPNIILFVGEYFKDFPTNATKIVILRSANGGGTWQDISGDLSGNAPGNDSNQVIDASEHSIADIFVQISDGTPREELWFSNLGGSTWQAVRTEDDFPVPVRIKDFHVPFQGNPAGALIFASDGEGEGSEDRILYRTEDRGSTWTDISPVFDGNSWAIARDSSLDQVSRQIRTHQTNRLFAAAILQREDGTGNDSAFFTALDGAQSAVSWTPRRVFTGRVGYLDWHKTNANILYMLGDNDNERILVTQDGGFSWEDKQPSWERDIGDIGVIGWDRVAFVGVWTV
jgi:hypothetical protein